ncbi:MAG: hypothetical protein L6R35_005281 [Caloplaca aegaea]|nr:MAG: hypothetical protein L6R35_005281 [Caloplaca aegaea]
MPNSHSHRRARVQHATMAIKAKVMPPSIGSMSWLDQENQQVVQFAAQEAEDFAFSVRNELDFLNEHMAEIFSKNQVNITEVFKTPGKLRGKTPRTAQKRNPLDVREPLNDIFASNAAKISSPMRSANKPREQRQFQVARDAAVSELDRRPKFNNDSGYHGMTEDEMEVDEQATVATTGAPALEETAERMLLTAHEPQQSREQSAADVSFHSAKEDLTREASRESHVPPIDGEVFPEAQKPREAEPSRGRSSSSLRQVKEIDDGAIGPDATEKASLMDEDVGNDSLRTPSESSSPAVKGLVRKSSLTFATLPAREPLTTKKSIGPRVSRTSHVDVAKGVMSRASFLGRMTGGKSSGGSRQLETASDAHDADGMDDDEIAGPRHEESDSEAKAAKLHSKSSTQRLHDRINMLGKSQPTRPTKSILPAAPLPQPTYPELPLEPAISNTAQQPSREVEEDDDWIQPPSMPTKLSPRPQLSKSISADVMENLRGKINISDEQFGNNGHEQPQSARRHSLSSDRESPAVTSSRQAALGAPASPLKTVQSHQTISSTTPLGTPVSTRHADGPISASKSKLQSIMKTARGLFTSSAGASAQAKMELRNHAKISSPNNASPSKPTVKEVDMELYPSLRMEVRQSPLPAVPPESPTKPMECRRTRSSIEKEKQEKERQRADKDLQKLRDQDSFDLSDEDRSKVQENTFNEQDDAPEVASVQQSKSQQQPSRKSLRRVQQDITPSLDNSDDRPDITLTKKSSQAPSTSHQSHLQKPREVKRPVKPAKEPMSKPEPQRVAIRVGTLSQRIPLSNAALSSGLQDSLPPPPHKQPGLAKKASTASIQTAASTTSLRSATNSKPKALIAAEKKKEQDEREAQRKLELKRGIERKRAAQQEETRRQEQMQRLEAEKQRERDRAGAPEDPKKVAHRQAIEKRRQELAKKEQQRTVSVSQQQPPVNSRPELGGACPPSKLHAVQQDHSRPQVNKPGANPAKAPIKRGFESEVDEPVRQSRLPGVQQYQANDSKRRRTDDEISEEPSVRPTMAPPKRQSNLLRDAQRPYGPSLMGPPSALANGYSHVKPTVTNHTHQPQYHHPARPGQAPQDMAKYANGRIVFAENSNPAYPSHKTPNQKRLTNQPLAKSSPQYVNGENIHLEDIPTDSDEDESDGESSKKAKGAMLPSWVQSPVLNQLLREQEKSTDPDSIFGPSAAVNMEEIFKERHHRFRSRTSSANWAGNDRLTEEEIRSDNAAREKMRREGGWTFGL